MIVVKFNNDTKFNIFNTVFMLIERMIQLPQENSIPGISIRTEATVCNYFL